MMVASSHHRPLSSRSLAISFKPLPQDRKATVLYLIAVALAFGPLALGLLSNVLNEYGLVSEAGTLNLFRMAPMYSMLTMPAAIVVLVFAVRAMFAPKPARRDKREPASWYL
jgi:hypothetical protein